MGAKKMLTGKLEIIPVWSRQELSIDLPQRLKHHFIQPRQIPILLAYENKAIIGWICLADNTNKLEDLFVDPKYRREGIATRLLRCISSLVLDYGCSDLSFDSELLESKFAQQFLNSLQYGKFTASEICLKSRMTDFQLRILSLNKSLKIPLTYGIERALTLHQNAEELTDIGVDCWNRPQQMLPQAAAAWTLMQHGAKNDGITLLPVSAFRSIDYQSRLIKRKLENSDDIESILEVSAAPGFSEHHTGRAIDITDAICTPLENEFSNSKAYQWLQYNAEDFGFFMSYPKDNPHGIIWEPWHWCWQTLGS